MEQPTSQFPGILLEIVRIILLYRARGNRTVYLLAAVVLIFILSWLPLNLFNVLLDLDLYSTVNCLLTLFQIQAISHISNIHTYAADSHIIRDFGVFKNSSKSRSLKQRATLRAATSASGSPSVSCTDTDKNRKDLNF